MKIKKLKESVTKDINTINEANEDLQQHIALQAEYDIPELLNEVVMYADKFNDSELRELGKVFGRFIDTVGQLLMDTADYDPYK